MNDNFLKTIFYKTCSYTEFVKNYKNFTDQKRILIKLALLSNKYGNKKKLHSQTNYTIQKHSTIEWEFEIYLMKKAIINNTIYNINFKVTPILTKQANNVFLLAMIYNRVDIVNFFLQNKLININYSIFGSSNYPSYFLLACACSKEVFNCFLNRYISYNISWVGLTPHLLCSMTNKTLPEFFNLDYITYHEYSLLNKFRGVKLKKGLKNYPLFVLDFICMTKRISTLRELLEYIPEAGSLSRLSFIVQNHDHFILIMTKYGFKIDQEFNGLTPLHINAMCNKFFTFIYLLYSGFEVLTNKDNKFPDEVAHPNISSQMKKLNQLCFGEVYYDYHSRKRQKNVDLKVFSQYNAEFVKLINSFDHKISNIWGILKYLKYNNENRIYTKSRFNIISLFSMSQSPRQIEIEVSAMETQFESIIVTTNEKGIKDKYNELYKQLK